MALTQISTQGIKDGTISSVDLPDQSVTLAKLPHGTSSNDGKFLRANNGADPTFETVSSIGGGTGVDFDDNVKARFGTGNDLQIYHDGSNSYIDDTGTGDLNISGSIVRLQDSNRLTYCRGVQGGAFEIYHNNALKFETTSSGATVTGDLLATGLFKNDTAGEGLHNTATGGKFFSNNSNDTHLEHGSNSQVKLSFISSSSTFRGAINGDANGMMILTGASGEEKGINCIANGATELYHDNSKKFDTNSGGVKVHGNLDVDDNNKLRIGTSSDLQIFHNGTDSSINNNTGNLIIGSANNLFLQNTSGEKYIKASANAAVELYHDNSKKLETRSDGLQVDGTVRLPADNSKLLLGANLDLQIYHDGSFNFIRSENGHPINLIKSNTENIAKFIPDGGVELYYDNSKKFETISTGIQMSGDIKIQDNHRIKIGADADLEIFYDSSANSKIQSNGSLTIKHQNGDKFIHCSSNSAVELYHDGTKKLNTHPNGIFTAGIYPFADNTHSIGSGSERFNTVFATQGINTSDKNEKNTIVECDLGLSFINKLKPVSYKWNKSDGKTHYGLIAQDIEETIKSVGKNLSDFGGIYKEENESMGLAYNEIFSPLIKAVQELSAKVAALEAS